MTETNTLPVSLESLKIRNFRNLRRLDIELPAEGAVIVGPNGAGKTNLLEAIYYLEIFRSFRSARDRDLVRFGEDVFRVEAATPETSGQTALAAAYERSTRRKRVELEGNPVTRLADALGRLGAVIFSLDDAEIVCGSPGLRRRFLDIVLSRTRPGYVATLQRYRAVLAQRNELLRSGAGTTSLEAWTAGLVEPAARLMAERQSWIEEVGSAFASYHAELAGGAMATLRYEPGLGRQADTTVPGLGPDGADSEQEWAEALVEALRRTAERERRLGATQVGPHRGDLGILAAVDGGVELRDLRPFGSGGQRRTAAIALRLIEADTVAEHTGRDPLYLLDDVFAELDTDRSARVVRLLESGRSGQVLLTVPKPADVSLRGGRLEEWQIQDGELRVA